MLIVDVVSGVTWPALRTDWLHELHWVNKQPHFTAVGQSEARFYVVWLYGFDSNLAVLAYVTSVGIIEF